MKNRSFTALLIISTLIFSLSQCAEKKESPPVAATEQKPNYGGYESQEKWGEHIVTISGCNDCHTPKKMGPHGPQLDSSLLLSGHPEKLPAPDVNRKDMESKGLIVTNDLTAWVGPWGISYTANLTPDLTTGTGNWKEENLIRALREGKAKGLESSRQLLPPMPWEMFRHMTDDEIKAIFAYLMSIKPIKNNVPQPTPPVSAPPGPPAK